MATPVLACFDCGSFFLIGVRAVSVVAVQAVTVLTALAVTLMVDE